MDKRSTESYEKVMLRLARLRTFAMAIVALALLFLSLYAFRLGEQVSKILNDAQSTFQTLNTLSVEIEQADIPSLFDGVSSLVDDAQTVMSDATDSVNQATEKIDEIDIETLNKAITDLSTIVAPLANLFTR